MNHFLVLSLFLVLWFSMSPCVRHRIIPDRSDTVEGKAFLTLKRVKSNIFMDARYRTSLCTIIYYFHQHYNTFTTTTTFKRYWHLQKNIRTFYVFMIFNSLILKFSNCENLDFFCFWISRRQESSFAFEDVDKWFDRLTEEIIHLGAQIHGPLGDSSFRLGDWCGVM